MDFVLLLFVTNDFTMRNNNNNVVIHKRFKIKMIMIGNTLN